MCVCVCVCVGGGGGGGGGLPAGPDCCDRGLVGRNLSTARYSELMLARRKYSRSDAIKNNCIPYVRR